MFCLQSTMAFSLRLERSNTNRNSAILSHLCASDFIFNSLFMLSLTRKLFGCLVFKEFTPKMSHSKHIAIYEYVHKHFFLFSTTFALYIKSIVIPSS